jgi:hypothetical protein
MEKEPHWIGHQTAERRQTESGYVYRDPDNRSLSVMIGVPGFHRDTRIFDGANLWEVDRFVEGLEANADPTAEKFREALNTVRELYKSGDVVGEIGNSKDWKSLHAHAEIINAGMRAQAQLERHRQALEIACALSAQRPFPDPPPPQGVFEQPSAALGADAITEPCMTGTAPIRTQSRKGDRWTDIELLQLLHESALPEMTQQKLADQYGVTRQRMSQILGAARGKHSKSKPVSVFNVANAKTGTRKRRNG